MRLDRDPALALEIHRVEHLRFHLARLQRARELEEAIGQRRFAVVDVRDDREVTDVASVHSLEQSATQNARTQTCTHAGLAQIHSCVLHACILHFATGTHRLSIGT